MKTLVAMVGLILLVSNASAVEISWMYVQNRKYETGRNLNRLAFGLIDEKGQTCTNGDYAVKVKLFAPDGSAVKLSKYRFDCDVEIFGIYDAVKSRWHYSDSWQFDSWFRADHTLTMATDKQ